METAEVVLLTLHTALPEQSTGTMIGYYIEYSELLIIEIVHPAKVCINRLKLRKPSAFS